MLPATCGDRIGKPPSACCRRPKWGSLRKRNLKYVKRVETGTQRYSVGMDTPRFGLILGRNSNWPAASSLTQSWYRSSWDSGQPKVQGTFADVIGI